MVDTVATKAAPPPAKGKKRTPAQLAFVQGITTARGKLTAVQQVSIASIIGEMRNTALSIVGDESFVDDLLKKVQAARGTLWDGIHRVLNKKQ